MSIELDSFRVNSVLKRKSQLSSEKSHRKSELRRSSLVIGDRASKVSFSEDPPDNTEEVILEKEVEEEKSNCPWDLIVNLDEKEIRNREIHHLTQKQIMISAFINDCESKVASWRPNPTKTSQDLNEMSLALRAACIENMVASQFCKWLRSLGGRPPNIDENNLKELFQIGIINPTSASFRTICEERTYIPELVAEKLDLPEKTLSYQLKRHLMWDISAERTPEKVMAFGKYLTCADQFKPPKNNTYKNWLACDIITEDMETFSHSFKNSK